MNILLIGSGAREHALAWKMAQSKKLKKLFILPGNAGTSEFGINIPAEVTDFDSIKKSVFENEINMVVVGPEEPLVKGIHDYFLNDKELQHVPIIGPQKEGAQLEGSKDFSKKFMMRHNIPTAAYQSFNKATLEQGFKFLETLQAPFVLKADGLAGGKGVLIIDKLQEAKKELASMLKDGKFGSAAQTVVIEEFLSGIEMSVFVLTDGKSYKILPSAKDYKRIGEGDTGLNTGGMGAISPVPFADEGFIKKVEKQIIVPTIEGLRKDSIPYKGFIFIGLMVVRGSPFVIEYNCRLGDPETEVVIPRIMSDLLELFEGVASQTLSDKILEVDKRSMSTVMLVSGGYPEKYENDKIISGLDLVQGSIVFHGGTKHSANQIKTNGGRVIAISSYGETLEVALEKSFANAEIINYQGKYYRKDIGFDILKK